MRGSLASLPPPADLTPHFLSWFQELDFLTSLRLHSYLVSQFHGWGPGPVPLHFSFCFVSSALWKSAPHPQPRAGSMSDSPSLKVFTSEQHLPPSLLPLCSAWCPAYPGSTPSSPGSPVLPHAWPAQVGRLASSSQVAGKFLKPGCSHTHTLPPISCGPRSSPGPPTHSRSVWPCPQPALALPELCSDSADTQQP